jgi:glyoxylase-like metal-dependent hydrolase (beta-lactamase superfamily II)
LFAVQACSSVSTVQNVAEAMGGVEAVVGAATLNIEGSGTGYIVGQAMTPNDGSIGGAGTYSSQMDLASHRLRTEAMNTAFGPQFELTTVASLDGDVAFNAGGFGPGLPARIGGTAAARRQAEYYHHPVALLQSALSDDPAMAATVGPVRQEMGHDIIPVATADGVELSLHVDPETGLPLAITSMVYDTNLGNVELSTSFADWAETSGLQLPGSILQTLDGAPVGDWTVTNSVNGDVGDLGAPADVAAAAADPGAPPPLVVEELAEGVWHLAGSHNSAVIEFPTYSVLVEAPINDARTLAVIAQARELVPDKPLQYVINTHHHFDHSGGIRAAVAEGLTVITHEINTDYYADIVARVHSLSPDHLETNPQPLMLETVTGDDVFELSDGDRVVQVLRVIGDPHNDGMLVIYLPAEQILIEGDDYSTAGPSAAPDVLLSNIQQRELQVTRIMPIHGPVVPLSDLESLVADMEAAGQ